MGDEMKRGVRICEPTLVAKPPCVPPEERQPAASVLGPSHPLVETIETLAEARRQVLAVGVILLITLPLARAGVPWAQTAALSAGAMICVLAAAALNLRCRRRRLALALIVEGREELPVGAVQEERRRLLDARGRRMLAASFDGLADSAATPATWPATSVFQRETVATVADELRDVGSLLRSEPTAARGVALARTLLTNGALSPLHRGEIGTLRRELRRIRFLLQLARP